MPEYLYYRIYDDTRKILKLPAPWDTQSGNLGRISVKDIAPPRNVSNIKQAILAIQQLTAPFSSLYMDLEDEKPAPDNELMTLSGSRGPGSNPEQPLGIVLSTQPPQGSGQSWGQNGQMTGPNPWMGGPNGPWQGGPGGWQGGPNGWQGGPNGWQGGPNGWQGGPNGWQGGPNGWQGGPNGPWNGGSSGQITGPPGWQRDPSSQGGTPQIGGPQGPAGLLGPPPDQSDPSTRSPSRGRTPLPEELDPKSPSNLNGTWAVNESDAGTTNTTGVYSLKMTSPTTFTGSGSVIDNYKGGKTFSYKFDIVGGTINGSTVEWLCVCEANHATWRVQATLNADGSVMSGSGKSIAGTFLDIEKGTYTRM